MKVKHNGKVYEIEAISNTLLETDAATVAQLRRDRMATKNYSELVRIDKMIFLVQERYRTTSALLTLVKG